MLKRLNHQQKDGVPFFSKLEHLDSTLPKPTQDLVSLVHTLGLKSTHKSPHKKMICHYTIWLMATKIQLFSILVSIFFHCARCKKYTHIRKKKVNILSNKQVGHWSLRNPEKVGLKGRNTTMFRYIL